jgi:Ring finger domain
MLRSDILAQVTISQLPSCTCPDHRKGNECKHKVYVLHYVLKAPRHLQYQLAFLSSELREIFASAPAIPTDLATGGDTDGRRKSVDGECAICYTEFDEAHNELVWCKAACGNNMHRSCFDQWAASQRNVGVKCVYCRTPWHVDPGDVEQVKKAGSKDVDGYVNVGEHFGISRMRDVSTYHPFWVSRHLGTRM